VVRMCFCVLKYIMYYEPMHFENKNLHQQTAIKKGDISPFKDSRR
jgi:hypothetical protein